MTTTQRDNFLIALLRQANQLTPAVIANGLTDFVKLAIQIGWSPAVVQFATLAPALVPVVGIAAIFGVAGALQRRRDRVAAEQVAKSINEAAKHAKTADELLRKIANGTIPVTINLDELTKQDLAEAAAIAIGEQSEKITSHLRQRLLEAIQHLSAELIEGYLKDMQENQRDLTILAQAIDENGWESLVLLRDLHDSIKATGNLDNDVTALKKISKEALERLRSLSTLNYPGGTVKIVRPAIAALADAARTGHCLVVGIPGSGKSGVLHDAAATLAEQLDVVVITADQLEADERSSLREDLGLNHNLPEVLEHWSGDAPGILIIDALDAARSAALGRILRRDLEKVMAANGRWRVVAAIRKFDLRVSHETQRLFKGQPVSEPAPDSEFADIRHINIPLLEGNEIEQIKKQSPELKELIERASAQRDGHLFELLRVPFNLRLATDLLSSGVSSEELTPIRTQIQLLSRYWSHRVLGEDSGKYQREQVVRHISELMVTKQSLHVDVSSVVPPCSGDALEELLREGVLEHWRPSPLRSPNLRVVSYSHHVLYDYATYIALFAGDIGKLVTLLTSRPMLALSVRPSIAMHFQQLWYDDPSREAFWSEVTNVLRTSTIPRIAHLIGPTVAVELIEDIGDLAPLMARLQNGAPSVVAPAELAVQHVAGTLLALDAATLTGPHAGPWAEWLEQLSRRFSDRTIGAMRALLHQMTGV